MLGHLRSNGGPLGDDREGGARAHQGERAFHGGNRHHPRRAGQVRDLYDLGDKLLLVATDRISAFDSTFWRTRFPIKGQVLTQLSKFWFELLDMLVENHLIPTGYGPPARGVPALYADYLRGYASQLVKKSRHVPRRVYRARILWLAQRPEAE